MPARSAGGRRAFAASSRTMMTCSAPNVIFAPPVMAIASLLTSLPSSSSGRGPGYSPRSRSMRSMLKGR